MVQIMIVTENLHDLVVMVAPWSEQLCYISEERRVCGETEAGVMILVPQEQVQQSQPLF